jgi:hypothetical protein
MRFFHCDSDSRYGWCVVLLWLMAIVVALLIGCHLDQKKTIHPAEPIVMSEMMMLLAATCGKILAVVVVVVGLFYLIHLVCDDCFGSGMRRGTDFWGFPLVR